MIGFKWNAYGGMIHYTFACVFLIHILFTTIYVYEVYLTDTYGISTNSMPFILLPGLFFLICYEIR